MLHPPSTFVGIDDDPGDLVLLKRHLQSALGKDVIFAGFSDSAEAIASLKNAQPDMIFLDYQMGDTNGLEVFESLRAEAIAAPVIMLTGRGDEEIAAQAMKIGAMDYLSKSRLTAQTLYLTVHNVMEKVFLRQQVKVQNDQIMQTERERVMYESLGAACHHFSQPLQALHAYLEMLDLEGHIDHDKRREMLRRCREAAEMMEDILMKLRKVHEYRTVPYAGSSILDIERKDGFVPRNPGARAVNGVDG